MEKGEIDIVAIIKKLKDNKKIILKTIFLFLVFGLCISLLSENEYTSSVTVVPSTNEGKSLGGSLGGLAAMAGVNLSGISGEAGIQTVLYPKVVNSVSFQLEMLKTPLTIEGVEGKISYEDYYTEVYKPSFFGYLKQYTIGLPGLIIKNFKGQENSAAQADSSGFFSISDKQNLMLKRFKNQISITVNEKEGFVKLTATMPEARASSELVFNAQKILQDYIIKFKLSKSKEQLKFVKERYLEKEKDFKLVQKTLAKFRDENTNVTAEIAKTKLQELESEYDLAYTVFLELAKQYETQQIKVKEDTPVFTVIEPISIPYERSFPKRGMIMLGFLVLGTVVGVLIVGAISLKDFLKQNL